MVAEVISITSAKIQIIFEISKFFPTFLRKSAQKVRLFMCTFNNARVLRNKAGLLANNLRLLRDKGEVFGSERAVF